MSRPTHAGGVVFRLTTGGPRYLLVEASGARGRWVFPKGRVEKGEKTQLFKIMEERGRDRLSSGIWERARDDQRATPVGSGNA